MGTVGTEPAQHPEWRRVPGAGMRQEQCPCPGHSVHIPLRAELVPQDAPLPHPRDPGPSLGPA